MRPISDLETRVLAAIDESEVIRDLTELVAIPSVDGSPDEATAQLWCADRLAGLGLDVDTWEIDLADAQSQPDFPGMEVERNHALGCVGILGDAATPALALYGHTDVVPPGELELWPDGDPYTLRVDAEGVAWGRGACDMKSGLVAGIAAVAALRRSDVELTRPLAVHCVSGEEDGGLGAFATLRRGHHADACLIAEPTAGAIISANAGSLTFRLDIPGRATHGSTRTRGVSAIEKFELIHRALRDLEARRNATVPELFAHLDLAWPLSVGVIEAGDWASTVPDQLSAWGRYGVRTDETLEEATRSFEEAVASACQQDSWLREYPVRVTWPGGRFAPGQLPDGHPLVSATAAAVADVKGSHPQTFGGPYGSDLRHYMRAGIAALQYGPGDVRYAHAIDEHVRLDEVYACARVYALLAIRSCGVVTV